MVTLDGIEFYMTACIPVVVPRNKSISSTGSSRNPINNTGYEGLSLRIRGFVTTHTAYDQMMDAILTVGQHSLIVDSGWKYRIHSAQKNRSVAIGFDGYYPFEFSCISEDPFLYSTASTVRSKSITTADQEWTADDSSNSILASGNVPARPTITVTAGAIGAGYSRDGADLTESTSTSDPDTISTAYILVGSIVLSGETRKKIHLSVVSLAILGTATRTRCTYQTATVSETAIYTDDSTYYASWTQLNISCDIDAPEEEDVTLRWYVKSSNGSVHAHARSPSVTYNYIRRAGLQNVVVYNTADDGVQCNICNTLLPCAVMTITPDGTGTLSYSDSFTDDKYIDSAYDMEGVTYYSGLEAITLDPGGYIIIDIDSLYPVASVPTLTAQIDIPGDASIQISLDGETFYDIKQSIIDDVLTEYPLEDAAGNSVLTGQTLFYIKINCNGVSTTLVKSIAIDCELDSMDAQIPIISPDAVNTFKCTQNADSSLSCTVTLSYEDRKWA